jgi:hypothetical protein
METDAVFDPVVVGLKVAAIEQLPAGAKLVVAVHEPEAEPNENSLAFVPVKDSPLNTKLADPLLVRVAVCAVLEVPWIIEPKAIEVRVSEAAGTPVAEPDKATVVVVAPAVVALWVRTTFAALAPAAAGLNCTSTVQVPVVAATLAAALQVEVAAITKSPVLVPVNVTADMESAAVPVLLIVKLEIALVAPTKVAGKLNEVGLGVEVGVPLAAAGFAI